MASRQGAGAARPWLVVTIAKVGAMQSSWFAFQVTALGARRRLFHRAEDGSLSIFALILFVLMAMMGGIAVDMMRHEQRRTALQQTVDRSVLAAASLNQTLDPEVVVNDYFAKAGLSEYLSGVTVTEGINFRTVQAEAQSDLDTFFMRMMGVPTLSVPAGSTAEQRISNVEISMVLDVSGSMQGAKLTNLKTAARNFVSRVLGPDIERRISISIVPYNGQVNLGQNLRQKFNVSHLHGTPNVNCIDLPPTAYNALTLSRTALMPQTAHADTFTGTNFDNWYHAIQGHQTNQTNNWCPPRANNIVRPLGHSIATLHNQINALEAVGATSINAGMRWGLTLLDPAMRGMVTELVAENVVNASFVGRPFDWDDEETMKVVILMTDGQHFAEERVRDIYRSGMSPIWFNASNNLFAIQHTSGRPSTAGSNQFWFPNRNSGNGEWRSAMLSGYTQQTWPQVWARARQSYVAWQLYARALGTNNSTRSAQYDFWINQFRQRTAVSDMDDQLESVCNLAKAQGVTIYGIAFEAPDNGEEVIEDCATDEHFYIAQGSQIGMVFDSIASHISMLRLTQ
jgi:Flp pilus assembly protein TadG